MQNRVIVMKLNMMCVCGGNGACCLFCGGRPFYKETRDASFHWWSRGNTVLKANALESGVYFPISRPFMACSRLMHLPVYW